MKPIHCAFSQNTAPLLTIFLLAELDGCTLSNREVAVVDPGGDDPEAGAGGAGIFGAPLTFSHVGNVPVITDVARYGR